MIKWVCNYLIIIVNIRMFCSILLLIFFFLEYNVMQPPPLNEKVLKDKRKKLKETLDRVLKMYVSISIIAAKTFFWKLSLNH